MKTTTKTYFVLLALTAIGVGCGSAKPFEIQMGEDAPMAAPADEGGDAQAIAPEEAAPAPQADAGDTADEAVMPENPENGAASPVIVAKFGDLRDYTKELKPYVTIPSAQQIADSGDRTAVYHFGGKEYFAQHPDAKIAVDGQDREEDVKYVVTLTPEQKQAILEKSVEKFSNNPAVQKTLQNIECLEKGLGRDDCDH